MKLRLEELRASGFKAFDGEVALDLSSPLTVIVGPIGTGKTSLLEAIEYALYGTLYDVKIRKELKAEDLVNDFVDRMSLRLVLRDERGRRYEIVRERSRDGRLSAALIVDGEVVEEDWSRVDERVARLVGVDLEGFVRQISLRHREIEDIVYGTDMRRSEALDRLLGIETLERVFRCISLKGVDEEIARLEREAELLRRQIGGLGTEEEIERELEGVRAEIEMKSAELERKKKLVESYRKELEELRKKEKEFSKLVEEKSRLEGEERQLKRRLRALEKEVAPESLELLLRKLKSAIAEGLREAMAYSDAEEVEGLPAAPDKLGEFVEAVREKLRKLERALTRLREEAMDLNYQYASEKSAYDYARKMLADVEARLYSLERDYELYESLLEKYGGDLERRIRELELELEKLDRLAGKEKCIVLLCRDVISEASKRGKAECPVCGSDVDESRIPEVEKRAEELSEADLLRRREEVERELEELKRGYSRLSTLEKRISEKSALEAERDRLREEIERRSKNVEELEEMLEDANYRVEKLSRISRTCTSTLSKLSKIGELEELKGELREVSRRLGEIRERLAELEFDRGYYESLEEAYYSALSESDRLSMELERLQKMEEELESRLGELRELGTELAEVEEKLEKLRRLRRDLLSVKKAFREIQSSLRKIMVQRIVELMNEAFRKMYVHPDFSELDLRIREAVVTREGREYKRSVYEIYAKRTRDGSWIPALKKMSDGQKRIVVLSLITSLFRLSPHNLSFIILDEPTPNIDAECRKAMVELLAKAKGIEQVVIATQDESFRELARVEPRASVYELRHARGGVELRRL